jgi:hypothetical protein
MDGVCANHETAKDELRAIMVLLGRFGFGRNRIGVDRSATLDRAALNTSTAFDSHPWRGIPVRAAIHSATTIRTTAVNLATAVVVNRLRIAATAITTTMMMTTATTTMASFGVKHTAEREQANQTQQEEILHRKNS